MTKTILEEYAQAYLEQIVRNSKLIVENSKLVQKMNILEKKLEIATKALIRIREVYAYNPNQSSYIAQFSNRKAKVSLKEMEDVK